MNIEIKNIEKTKLKRYPLLKTIEKFSGLKKDIRLVFTSRLSYYGRYTYISKEKIHKIEISTIIFQYAEKNARIYEMIGSILHELKHAEQQEVLGSMKMMSVKFHKNKKIKGSEASDFFSICENEARIAEEINLMPAVDYYWKCCNDVLR